MWHVAEAVWRTGQSLALRDRVIAAAAHLPARGEDWEHNSTPPIGAKVGPTEQALTTSPVRIGARSCNPPPNAAILRFGY